MTMRSTNSSILVRACSRCGGDLFRDVLEDIRDQEEEYVCLQCGRRTTRSVASGHTIAPSHDRRIARRSAHSRMLE